MYLRIEVKPVPHKVQPIFYRNKSESYCEISFNGKKFYTFKKVNVEPYSWVKKLDYILYYTDNEMIKGDGYYGKAEKTVYLFYNRYIYRAYRNLINRQKLTRNKQTFLISDDEIRRKEKLSIVRDWMDEYGQPFLNADNVKKGDVFCIKSIEVVENELWDNPRIQFTLAPVTSKLEGEEYMAGMGKQNLERLIEGFGTDNNEEWLEKNIECAVLMTYNIGGNKQRGIVWDVSE